ANCAVCKADDSAATALSSSDASKALYGTQCIGFYGKIRSWKSVAVLQMLEKQMGPESFCKVLKNLVAPPKDTTRPHRTLSTKEFRHLANEVGNLERPFLREFFPRWVGSSGCPVLKYCSGISAIFMLITSVLHLIILRMGFSYNKRKNLVELAALRGCTATPDSNSSVSNTKPDFVKREADVGWPGMMSIRVHELDGMYDHPVLPMAGETWQLLEIQCHSKLAAKRFQKPKKGSKHDGSDDNINQLEKDKDVVAQAQAITALELFPRLLSIVNALSNLLCDSQCMMWRLCTCNTWLHMAFINYTKCNFDLFYLLKAFWRVRIEAAFALASTASEETDWAGLLHLIKFYKSRRYDEKIGLPKPNDFHDFAEYFVLEAIPHAVALVRAADKKSPREAVEFILQLLKVDYNENNGNPYSDVYWLAALVQSVGELEFGQQSVPFLSSLVKRIDRLLQFDRLIPSYNGILTVSCIRALTQIALKLSEFIPLDRIIDLIKPFCSSKTQWQVRIEAFRALLDLEYHCKGIDAALILFVSGGSDDDHGVVRETLVALLRLLESPAAFNNVTLRHYLFCILQGHTEICNELKNFFAAIVNQSKPMDPSSDTLMLPYDGSVPETTIEPNIVSTVDNERSQPEDFVVPDAPKDASKEENYNSREEKQPDIITIPSENLVILDSSEAPKEPDTVSNSQERKKPMLKIKMKQSSASSRAEEAENAPLERSQGAHNGADHGTSSSMSMEAPPQRNFNEPANVSNQNLDDVNSCHDLGSRVTASIGSAKLAGDGDSLLKELQCTADSSKVQANDVDPVNHNKFISLRALNGADDGSLAGPIQKPVLGSKDKKDKKKKDKEKKRKKRDEHKSHKDDPEYLERKRLKKEKKRKEKELAKLMVAPATDVKHKEKTEAIKEEAAVVAQLTNMATSVEEAVKRTEPVANRTEGTTSTHKLKIKIKNRTLTRP
ncbi:hypothetical protein Ccrd_026234, partial [Cynara cardunculus var. scolymus]